MNKKLGKILLANDASTLSNLGFEKSPDAAIFAKNIANWFTGGRLGKFHSYLDPDLAESELALAQTMTKAGHTWTVGYDIPEDVDAIFSHDTYVWDRLTDFLGAGGNIYLAAETEDEDYACAYDFNWFLWEVGLQFKEGYNGISGNQPINSSHPIFALVKSLYQRNGSSIIDFQPDEHANQILVSSPDGEGLYAILDLSKATPHVRINRIFSDPSVESIEADEYIAIVNEGLLDIDISDWKIQSLNRNQEFFFPTGTVLKKGAECRVYTNQMHPESGGFCFGSKRSVWNNSSDEGRLYDAQGNLMSSYAYTEQSQKLSHLTKSLGLDNLILEADPEAIKAQKALGGQVTFEEALNRAYDSFEGDNTLEGSAVDAIAANAAAVGVPYAYFNGERTQMEANLLFFSTQCIMSTYTMIYQVVRQIPPGKVATYGQVADLASLYGKARLVGYALYQIDISLSDVPWHRVVNAKGEISQSPARYGAEHLQRSLLELEGIKFNPEGKINLKEYLWKPEFFRDLEDLGDKSFQG